MQKTINIYMYHSCATVEIRLVINYLKLINLKKDLAICYLI